MSDGRAPLASVGGGRGDAPACCACTARAPAVGLQCPRPVWTTGELQGLALAPTQQSGLVLSPWGRGGKMVARGPRGCHVVQGISSSLQDKRPGAFLTVVGAL